ncbi:MAG: tripartite tricarboxylate transporter substrate binding protein [Betaproteobacteria bacterium]|nr:tripartite tricarboxylate transporter substrate binding protein [Betaproteobacteria bacterium]
MKISNRLLQQLRTVFSLVLCASITGAALAQSYPTKPIRFIVAAAPGGGSDYIARIVGQKLSAALGQTVVIDNRGGAAGNIGAELTARASPDGYTLVVVASSHASNINLYRKLYYDPVKDFAPVTQLVSNYFLLAVQPSSPPKTVKEFIAFARSKKGELTYGSAGSGQGAHLGMELLKTLAGFDAVHVPYSGIGPATVALLAGQVDVALLTPPSTLPQVKAGKLKVLAVTSLKRMAVLPSVPTIAESGFPGFEVNSWQGLLAPAGTPREIVTKLYEETSKSLKLSDVLERLAVVGAQPVGSTPEEFAGFIQAEITKWEKVIKQSGARAD